VQKNLYPVKLRVYSSALQASKLYSTKFKLDKKTFKSAWETIKPRKDYLELREEMESLKTKATEDAKSLDEFNFEQFEKKMFRKSSDGNNVFYHYDDIINNLSSKGRIGTADNYRYSLKAIKAFVKKTTNREPQKLLFNSITIKWLEDFEEHLLKEGKSISTVGIYLRPLRAVINKAIEEKDISKELYPFGKSLYMIPNARRVKKALSKEQLRVLYNAKPETPEQEKAKDFWFFSFSCNGMNIKDILLLKWHQLDDDSISFFREKVKRSTKDNQTEIIVYLNDYTKTIIEKYASQQRSKNDYVFDILKKEMTLDEVHRKVKNFIRYINQHMKKLAKANNLNVDISTYHARHSFATKIINDGASMEFAMEALGHQDIATTKNYYAGFEDNKKKEIMKKLMDF
jgi:integrase